MQTRNLKTKVLAALSVTLLPLSLSCDNLECGDGTTEVDGECAPAEGQVPEENCGPGTVLMDGRCVSLTAPTVCGENTTEIEDPDNPGSFICVGVGNCEAALLCTAPTVPDSITVCGRIQDIGTGAPTQFGGDTETTPCTEGDTGTPCEFIVQLQQSNGAGGLVEIAAAPTFLDQCGRFRFENVPVNPGAFVPFGAVVVANANTDNEGGRPPTGTALALPQPGDADGGNVAFSLSGVTVGEWVGVDATLAAVATDGGVMLRYLNPSPLGPASAPAATTKVWRYEQDTPSDDGGGMGGLPYLAVNTTSRLFYFADVNPLEARVPSEEITPGADGTGANGWALALDHPTTPTPGPSMNCGDGPGVTAGEDQCVYKFFGVVGEEATCDGLDNTGMIKPGVFFPVPLPTPRVAGVVLVLPMPLINAAESAAAGTPVPCDL